MKQEHSRFVQGMILHGDKKRAYKEAYPDVTDESARVAANRLLREPEIWQCINEITKRAQQKALEELEAEATGQARRQLLSLQSKRAVLAAIVNGDVQRKRYIKLRDRVEVVFEDVSVYAMLRAIELDSRLAGELRPDTKKNKVDELRESFEGYQIFIGDEPFDAGSPPPQATHQKEREAPKVIVTNWRKGDDEMIARRPQLNWDIDEVREITAQMKQDYKVPYLGDEAFLKWLAKMPAKDQAQRFDDEMAASLLAELRRAEANAQTPLVCLGEVALTAGGDGGVVEQNGTKKPDVAAKVRMPRTKSPPALAKANRQ